METCVKCKRELPESAFAPSVLKHRMVVRCKDCVRANKRRGATQSRDCARCGVPMPFPANRRYCSHTCRIRTLTLRQYGLAASEDIAMHEQQGGLCAACLLPLGDDWTTMHVDHHHDTGAVRGLLHARCNKQLADDPEQQFRLAVYLARHELDLRSLCL